MQNFQNKTHSFPALPRIAVLLFTSFCINVNYDAIAVKRTQSSIQELAWHKVSKFDIFDVQANCQKFERRISVCFNLCCNISGPPLKKERSTIHHKNHWSQKFISWTIFVILNRKTETNIQNSITLKHIYVWILL